MPPTDAPRPAPGPEAYPHRLTEDQIDQLAAMIADDRCAFPDDLTPPDRARLLEPLRCLLRQRLVQLIARALAQRLHHGPRPPCGGS